MSPTPPIAGGKLTARQRLGFMAMIVGMFMSILDIQIVSASISEIQSGLSASPDEVAWVQTSYLIAEIVMIPLSGWLSRLLSTRVLFVTSALGFSIFSAACASVSSLSGMVVFRVLQGFIGGAMIPTVFATSFLLFSGQKRVQASVVVGLTATMAPTIGPTLGGWLTEQLSWHWLFLINVPVGLTIAGIVWTSLDIDKPNFALRHSFDSFGLFLMAGFLGSLEYVLEEGSRWDWFADDTIFAFGVFGTLCAIGFFWRMLTRADPLVELRTFKNLNFTLGCVFSLVLGLSLYGSVYLVPLFLGRVRQLDSLQIGETMFITGATMLVSAPIVGRLARALDLRVMLAIGLSGFGAGIWWLGHLTVDSSFWELFWPQALRGASMMWVILPVNQLALGTLPPAALKNGAGLYNLMRNMGGAIGLALINTVATARLAHHTLHLQEQVTWARPAATLTMDKMTRAMAAAKAGDAHLAALKKVSLMVQAQALTLTYNDVLMLMALSFFVAVPATWLLAAPKPAPDGAEAH